MLLAALRGFGNRYDGHVYYDNRLIGKVSQWFVSVLVKKVDIFPLR